MPVRVIKTKTKPHPFITTEINTLMHQRDLGHRIARKTHNLRDWSVFRQVKLSLQRAFVRNEIQMNKIDPNSLWKTIRRCLPVGDSLKPTYSKEPSVIGQEFNEFFMSVGQNAAEKAKVTITANDFPIIEYSNTANPEEESLTFSFEPVSCETIGNIISAMPKNKAPGLDKITLKFITDCLPYIIQPITDIVNLSLTQGIFPNGWKKAEVIPIPKTDEAEHASNNRPISLLPILSKICECVVHQQFTNYLTTNKLLSIHQNGNKQYHSIKTLCLQITDDAFNAMVRKEITAMILLDLSKAYDSICHSLLVAKLESIGVSGITRDWFISYLKDRKQHVRIESHLSEPIPVNYGVPQGSILRDRLFNIFANDLCSVTTSASTKSYVHDTKLYLSFRLKELNEGLVRLKADLNKVAGWCSVNQLLINPDKTQFILFGVNQLLRHVPVNIELPFLRQNSSTGLSC